MVTAATATTAATAADTLRAIETRAERAIVQQLRQLVQEILGMRTHLVLEDRAQGIGRSSGGGSGGGSGHGKSFHG